MKITDYVDGRDNNFNLLRILAALAVLISHSFVLALGPDGEEPLRAELGTSLGSIGVDIFFVASGFLVTRSLLMRQDALEFFWSRVLRIYPALVMMTLLTVLVLGPVMTALTLTEYFSKPTTFLYFLKNASLLHGVAYQLPGVFDSTPYPHAVNGALWSLPFELGMYLILFVVWCLLRVLKSLRVTYFAYFILFFFAMSTINYLPRGFASQSGTYLHGLLFMFFAGASAFVMRDKIVLRPLVFYAALVFLVLSTKFFSSVFFLIYSLCLPYLVLYVVFVPAGIARQYNRLGDYSYGLYIYAFPVQQTVAAFFPQISVWNMIWMSGGITMVLAVLSWHCLERHSMTYRALCIETSRRLMRQLFPQLSSIL